MTDSDKTQLEEIAKALLYTLGSIPSEEADKVVARVIQTIYNDLLDKKGKIVKGFDAFIDYKSDFNNPHGKHSFSYKWVEDKPEEEPKQA